MRGRSRSSSLHLQAYMQEDGPPGEAPTSSCTPSPRIHCCSKAHPPCSPCPVGDEPPCGHSSNRLLVFVVTGVLEVVVAFLTGVIYFSVRSLTTSLEHLETIPTYANGILLLCTGILVIFLFKKRDLKLLVATMVLNLVCSVLCGTSAILTAIRSMRTLQRFDVCQYDSTLLSCHCYITKVTDAELRSLRTRSGELEYVFKSSPSCGVIQYNLKDYMLALCSLYSLGTLLCIATVAAILFVKHSLQFVEQSSPNDVLTLPSHMEAPAYEENQSFTMRRPSSPPQQRRSCTTSDLLFPRMALPGMDERLSQSLGLPGDSQARLLRIRRHNSLDSIPLNTTSTNQRQSSGVSVRRTSSVSTRDGDCSHRPSSTTVQETRTTSLTTPPREPQELRTDSQFTVLCPRALSVQPQHEREVYRSMSDSSRSRPRRAVQRYSYLDSHTIPLYPARPLATSGHHGRQRRRHAQRARASCGTHSYSCPRRYLRLTPQDRNGVPSHMAYLHLMDSVGGSRNGASNGASFPYPCEPPPPYSQCHLPPYVENDPAPSYRSRSSPVPEL